ncbi:MAG: hypothetical protein ACKOWQ_04850 [Aquirufa sp.]
MNNFIDFAISLFTGVTTGVVASYFFLKYFLSTKKPDIVISDYISKQVVKEETSYLLKFVNLTDSEIFDIHIELTFYKPIGDYNGGNLLGNDIKLKDNFLSYLPNNSTNNPHNLHAVRIRTTENIEEMWDDSSSFIRLSIIAKHSLSGFNKVFKKDFINKECITEKRFLSGNDLSVN